MAARIIQIAMESRDPEIAIRACKVGLDKVVPNLEGVTIEDERPLQHFTDEQLQHQLNLIRSSRNGHTDGNGASA